ncbi:MAG: hypothetical protein QY309_13700 [Cyclobacteriaceae bacterium]|nr:MAG: hypothetical protein QY309_13700 [Cyclobacteriaceae bacterium]
MEELDDLKSIWKQQAGFEVKNEGELLQMLGKSSNTIISKLKRSVWFELIFTVACILVLGMYTTTIPHGALMWTILSLLVLLISYTLYYVKKIMLLNQYDSSSDNLKANLRHLLERLDAYMKFYKRSYTILYPVFFVLGLLFGALESGFDRFIHKFENPLYTASFIILSIIFMVGVYTITNWYLKKLYGNHIEKLRSILDDLKD